MRIFAGLYACVASGYRKEQKDVDDLSQLREIDTQGEYHHELLSVNISEGPSPEYDVMSNYLHLNKPTVSLALLNHQYVEFEGPLKPEKAQE